MDTVVLTKVLGNPGYVLTVKHEVDDNSYISFIIKLPHGHGPDSPEAGEMIYSSYPKETAEEAQKAAMEYYAQLNK